MQRLVVVAGLLLLTVLITSCDPMESITFINETDEKLNFYAQSDVQAALLGARSVEAGSSVEYPWVPADYKWLRVAATKEDGQWVFDRTYPRAELEKMNRRIVVSSLKPISPPADVPVSPSLDAPRPVLAPRKTKVDPVGSPSQPQWLLTPTRP